MYELLFFTVGKKSYARCKHLNNIIIHLIRLFLENRVHCHVRYPKVFKNKTQKRSLIRPLLLRLACIESAIRVLRVPLGDSDLFAITIMGELLLGTYIYV